MNSNPANSSDCPVYSYKEELINIFSHGIGAILSIIALVFLILRSANQPGIQPIISFTVFGLCLVLLYVTSTLYHLCNKPALRKRLRIFDHATIYFLIAGTYTPFALLILEGRTGWLMLAISWGMALIGVILKIFFTGRFKLLSTFIYVFMGWLIIFAFKPLKEGLPTAGLLWLICGGILYSIGAVLYSIKKIPFNHAMFHCFVLSGSICHFVTVYYFVLIDQV